MRLLFDQNLSHKLPGFLADAHPDSTQVRLIGLERASDDIIWRYARDKDFAIVTQDADFAERSRLHGSPPKVVWLRCGNRTARTIEQILRRNQSLLLEFARDPELHLVEILG